jgi:ribonuclease E
MERPGAEPNQDRDRGVNTSMIVTNRRALVALVAALALTGCAKPPAEAIAAADAAQQAAVAAEAEQYAPEAMNAVTEAKAALDAEIAAQAEKMALTRSYKKAEELVAAYKTAAEQATTAAAAGKEQAKNEATQLIADGRTALEAATAALAKAPRGKGSAPDLAAMKADLEAAGTSLTEAEGSLAAGTFLDAKSKATSAKETIQRVMDAITQAQSMRR